MDPCQRSRALAHTSLVLFGVAVTITAASFPVGDPSTRAALLTVAVLTLSASAGIMGQAASQKHRGRPERRS